MILPLDLGATENIEILTRSVIDKYGKIDVLVNNGGISQRALAKDSTLEIDRKIMEVDCLVKLRLQKVFCRLCSSNAVDTLW